ncbi:N(2)-acetyl-L-2,4-diaminobutanoate deacetylase DoeB [Pseudogemmobacter sp. W21_MBD1_M6]|uniref:N(2)-acetyl-L-2,4-diaminobutanoate deacetylase DoeB n=1 Tax=Pseudogemmobacter sp. W21_MBD1_M6 TaxID=3240271 RepID=UPI003F9E94FC
MTANPIRPTIPLDRDGVHHGFLRLPHSRNDSAWGAVMIPITVVQNGNGPTALLTGGNHGDEYEGPVALQQLAATLTADRITGRVIIVPFFNAPAVQAGTRVSPIDQVNLNRAFPGDPAGTATSKIADYFNRVLVPMADVVLDFHSGGKTLDFLPFAAIHILPDARQQAASEAAMMAFNAPYSMRMLEIDGAAMYDTAVEAQGKVFVTTELGGGGTATTQTIGIARKGARNLLIHAGILNGRPDIAPSVMLDMPDSDCFVISNDAGLFEPLVDLGDTVTKDQPVARIWSVDRSGQPPVTYTANRAGLVTARHFPGVIQMGDCMTVVAVVLT